MPGCEERIGGVNQWLSGPENMAAPGLDCDNRSNLQQHTQFIAGQQGIHSFYIWTQPDLFLGHLLRDDLINPVKMSVRPSTIKLNAATNHVVVFVRVDETFTTI